MATAMAWVLGGTACTAHGTERVAAAGATTTTGGWRASLFVTRPQLKEEPALLRGSSTVGARFSRSIARNTRLSVDVFNVFDSPATAVDPLALTRGGARASIAESYLFHPGEGRGVRVGISVRF
jgi:hypothetical protein